MLKKSFIMFLVAILALPVFSMNAFAETESIYADGEYKIDVNFKKETENADSVANNYVTSPVDFTVKDGQQYIKMEITGTNMVKRFEAVDFQTEVLSENEAEDKMVIGFPVTGDLSEHVMMEMDVVVPGLYEMTHKARAFFDTSDVDLREEEPEEEPEQPEQPEEPEQPEPEQPEQPEEPEEPKEEPTKEFIDLIDDADEAYLIDFVSESRAVNGQFENPATLLYKDGKKYIQMSGTGGQFIEWLTINGVSVGWGEQNEDGSFIVQFEHPGNLSDQLDFGMLINTGQREMEHEVDLTFDESTKRPVEEDKEPEAPEEEPEDPKQPEKPEEDPKDEDKNKNEDENNKEEEIDADKLYTINYVFKHATEDKESAANGFFTGQALIVERDGERFVRVTTNAPQFIDSLVAVFGNDRVALELVENIGDSAVYEFKLPNGFDLSQEIRVEMEITVPGVYDGMVHDTRLVFDVDSLTEIESEDDIPAPEEDNNDNGNNDNGENGNEDNNDNNNNDNNNGLDPNTPEKPELGDGDNNDEGPGAENNRNALNPQTGENTNILLYVLLLIGSAIPLAIQVKRRFI